MVFPQNHHPVVVSPQIDIQHVLIHLTQELSRRCKAQIPPMQNIPFTACNKLGGVDSYLQSGSSSTFNGLFLDNPKVLSAHIQFKRRLIFTSYYIK